MKQPLITVALLYVGGILAAEITSLPVWLLLAICLSLTVVALSWPRARLLLLFPLIALTGLTNATLRTTVLSPIDLRNLLGREPHLVTVRGEIIETPTLRLYDTANRPTWRTQTRMEVSAIEVDKDPWRPAAGDIAISTAAELTNFWAGQVVEVTGVAALPSLPVAEGIFDYRNYLRRQEIYYLLRAESAVDWRVIRSPTRPPLADRFITWARSALARGLPVEDQSLRLEWALALGWKTALTEETSEPFVQAATYHIFAVDGLRMAIVFGIFFSVLRTAGMSRWICGIILLPVIWFYVALTGWPASAIRASVMLTIILCGWALKRPSNPMNSLFAAALLILIWQPQQLFQAGFQLSFFVVLCLILIIPPMFELIHRITAPDPLLPRQLRHHPPQCLALPIRYFGEVSVTSFAAWIGSIPLVAYYFNIITPVSTPANVLAVPLCVLVLISNLLSLLFAAWFPGAAELFNHAGWFLMESIRVSSEWFARWPAAYYYTPAPSVFTTCLYYALLLALLTGWLFRSAFRTLKITALSAALLIWGWYFFQQAATTRLTVMPVNGGMTVYCNSPGRTRDLLIDTGPSNSVQFITRNFLHSQGVNRLPAMVLSHGDVHHTAGAETILSEFQVSKVYASPVRFRSVQYRRMLGRLESAPGLLENVHRNQSLGNWTVLHPDLNDRFSKADDGAVVLAGRFGQTRVLLLSDLAAEGQTTLLRRNPDLGADIVVTGLPASGEPLGQALLEAIHPKAIIVGDSQFPFAERAKPDLRTRLARQHARVLYTSDTGAVTLEFRRHQWQLRTISGQRLEGNQ